jgi:hypothetical protein
MNTTAESTRLDALRRDMRRDMLREMRALMGSGFVPEYYVQLAEPFVEIAQTYVEEAARAGGAEALRRYADTIENGPRLRRADEVADMRDVAARLDPARGEG